MIKQIDAFIAQYNLLPAGSTVVLGLSGGPDSVFLLHLLADKNIKLIAAHLDHEWRADSADDVTFCKKLAQKYNVPFITAKASELKRTFKWDGSQEQLGRAMRRHFFATVAAAHATDSIALAHHAQDQQETFFIRLMRGRS